MILFKNYLDIDRYDVGFVFCADFNQSDEFVLQQSQLGNGTRVLTIGTE